MTNEYTRAAVSPLSRSLGRRSSSRKWIRFVASSRRSDGATPAKLLCGKAVTSSVAKNVLNFIMSLPRVGDHDAYCWVIKSASLIVKGAFEGGLEMPPLLFNIYI